jgi:hypothetical protein
MLVTWERLQRKVWRSKVLRDVMRARNAQICPACRECYEPCVEVAITGHNIWHLVPISVHIGFGWDTSYEYLDYVFPLCACGELVIIREGPLWRIVRSKYSERRFLWMIIRRYPQLLGSPLTASVLQKAGCDIEAEWALWQLAGGE